MSNYFAEAYAPKGTSGIHAFESKVMRDQFVEDRSNVMALPAQVAKWRLHNNGGSGGVTFHPIGKKPLTFYPSSLASEELHRIYKKAEANDEIKEQGLWEASSLNVLERNKIEKLSFEERVAYRNKTMREWRRKNGIGEDDVDWPDES